MKSIQRTLQIFKVNGREILLFEVLYRIGMSMLFLSLFTRGIAVAIRYSGYSYLTAKNIGFFLLRPVTILVLLLAAATGTVILMIESASLLAAFQAGERMEKLTAHQILIRGLGKCRYYLKKENLYVAGINILLAFLFHYVLLWKAMLHIKPISDLVKNIGQSRAGSGAVIILTLALIFALLPGLFTLHFGLLNQKDGKEAWRESWHLLSRNIFRIAASLFLLNVILYIMYRLLLLGFTFITAEIIYHFVSKSIRLALLLTACDWLELGVLLGGSILAGIFNMALLTGLYYTARDRAGLTPELLISEAERRRNDRKTRRTRTLLIIVGLVCASVVLYDVVENGIRFAREVFMETEITAHRGSSIAAPENTLAAIELAIGQMADYAEIDVQETADGEVILLHDKSFKRTCMVNKRPWNMTMQEVMELNAAAYMKEYEETKVPTLREVLGSCRDRINLNIELKNNGYDKDLPDKVVALILEYDMESQCVITSTSLSFLKRVKELDPDLKTGYILSSAYGEFYKNDAVDFFSVNSALLNERNMELIHEYGREIHAWTVNSKTEMERLKHLGVDNIITDYPVLAREILYREEDTEGFLEFVSMVLD